MDDHSFERSAQSLAKKYDMPDASGKRAFVQLGALLDTGLPALDLIIVQRAYGEMYKAIEEVYRPRSPLEAQLEYDRARKDMVKLGIESPDWVAAEDPEVLKRWANWIDSGHGN